MKPLRRVFVPLGVSSYHAREILIGIRDFAERHGPWQFQTMSEFSGESRRRAWRWKVDGYIGLITTANEAAEVLEHGVPAVNVSPAIHPALPTVCVNNLAVGRLAADHLLERGFRSLGYMRHGTNLRQTAFVNAILAAGCTCSVYPPNGQPPVIDWLERHEAEVRWVSSLVKPAAVLAANDVEAIRVVDACQAAGIPIPGQVALMGVDNDELLCESVSPTLTSIALAPRRIGYRAAALLDELMDGKAPPAAPFMIDPIGVVTRESTDSLVVRDPDVETAARYIRLHATEPIGVEDVVRQVPLSRRTLERRFRLSLGRTPAEEIERVRMEHVRKLLVETDYRLVEVGLATGFQHSSHLARRFKALTGSTPSEYRARFNRGNDTGERKSRFMRDR